MSSPPQNIGSDEDGELSASGDEAVGNDNAQDSSATSAGHNEEESRKDLSPPRKKLKLDTDAIAEVENVSSPSSAAGLSTGEGAMEVGEEPNKDDSEEEGEEGEILSDSDEDEQISTSNETANEASSKTNESSARKKSPSKDHSSRDEHRSPSPNHGYEHHRRRRDRYSDYSQSSLSPRNTLNSSGSTSSARKSSKRTTSGDRRTGTDTRNRREGSPFTKRKPKMKAPPPSTSPFWGERKHLLPNPNISPRTGYNLDSDYPQLPRRLIKEYFPAPPIRFVRDSHNFAPPDHSKSDGGHASITKSSQKDDDSKLSLTAIINEEEVDDTVTEEGEGIVPSLPSMQDLVKNQIYTSSSDGLDALTPILEDQPSEAAHSLAEVFSEDFPLLDGEATPEQEQAISLKKLVAGGSGVDITIAAGEQRGNLNSKVARRVHKQLSAKKQLKATAWHTKQKAVKQQKDTRDYEKSSQPCKYFQNGFCKSGDACPYSHAGSITKVKKKEVCRYYLGDNCTKGDECPYLHETFPCKFFHSRNFCIHGDSCRFSHDELTDEGRELLAIVLQQDSKQLPAATTPSNNEVALPPQLTPLMSVDTSAMASLVGGAAPPLMQQDHQARPPWDGAVQPPIVMPTQFGSGPPTQLPELNSTNVLRPPDQKLGILPTPPAYMKLVPGNQQMIQPPVMNVTSNINLSMPDPRSSCDPRMNQMQHQQHLNIEPVSSHEENNKIISQLKQEDDQDGNDVDTRQPSSDLPLFQPLELPKELFRPKPHFIPELPSSASTHADASLPSHITRPINIPYHNIDQDPSRPRNLKSKYSHLKVKSRSSKSAMLFEEQAQPITTKQDSTHKSILKRTVDKPKEPFSIYSHSSPEQESKSFEEAHSVFSDRTTTIKHNAKIDDPEKATGDSDKAANKESSVPYYAMFDTGFGSDLQIDSAFGSLED